MFKTHNISNESPAEFYRLLKEQTSHLIEGETNYIANLANVSSLLNMHLQDINWVGFYLWDHARQELVLGPFQGKPACIRIPVGRGVCGTAVKEGRTQLVADVFEFPGHIACDADSRSEIVIPLYQNGDIVGVLDIDSPIPNRFAAPDAEGLTALMEVLLRGTEFPHEGNGFAQNSVQ
jgi:L-methionine (R)-S-oxide reductase